MAYNLFEFFNDEITVKKDIIDKSNQTKEDKTTEFSHDLPLGDFSNGLDILSANSSLNFNFGVENFNTIAQQKIAMYRVLALHPEAEEAIDEIINEILITDTSEKIVSINLKNCDLSDRIKNQISEEFDHILSLLNFNSKGYDLIKNWYIDGKLYLETVINPLKQKEGILKIKYIDPLYLNPYYCEKDKVVKYKYLAFYGPNERFPIAVSKGRLSEVRSKLVDVPKDLVVYVGSGKYRQTPTAEELLEISHLDAAIKPINNLANIEDSIIIYRMSRASEKRAFYVSVANMTKTSAEAYIQKLINKHKNQMIYDTTTGLFSNKYNIIGMTQDFWFPVNSNGSGTKVEILEGGKQLSELDDLYYFVNKVWRALKIPESRRDTSGKEKSLFPMRLQELDRTEIAFNKMIGRRRKKFSQVFTELLKRQLSLKNIMTPAEYKKIENDILYDFTEDNYYKEIKETELMNSRLDLLLKVEPYIGKFFTVDEVATQVLKMSEEDWKDKQAKLKQAMKEKEKTEKDEVKENEVAQSDDTSEETP